MKREIRTAERLIITELKRHRIRKNRMFSSKTRHILEKQLLISVRSFTLPIDPADRIILTISIIISRLRVAELIATPQKRNSLRHHDHQYRIAPLALAQTVDIPLRGRTFYAIIIAEIPCISVTIILSVVLIVTLIIHEQIRKCESVIVRNIIDKAKHTPLLALLINEFIQIISKMIEHLARRILIFVLVDIQIAVTALLFPCITEIRIEDLGSAQPLVLRDCSHRKFLPEQMKTIHMILHHPETKRRKNQILIRSFREKELHHALHSMLMQLSDESRILHRSLSSISRIRRFDSKIITLCIPPEIQFWKDFGLFRRHNHIRVFCFPLNIIRQHLLLRENAFLKFIHRHKLHRCHANSL